MRPCVPCVSRLPPVTFYRYSTGTCVSRLPPVSFYRHALIRVPACARVSRVSRVCPGSPRCLFTGTHCVCPARLPHVSFYRHAPRSSTHLPCHKHHEAPRRQTDFATRPCSSSSSSSSLNSSSQPRNQNLPTHGERAWTRRELDFEARGATASPSTSAYQCRSYHSRISMRHELRSCCGSLNHSHAQVPSASSCRLARIVQAILWAGKRACFQRSWLRTRCRLIRLRRWHRRRHNRKRCRHRPSAKINSSSGRRSGGWPRARG